MARESKSNGSNGHATAIARRPSRADSTAAEADSTPERLPVLKTYKIYVGGKFPRTETGRYYVLKDPKTGQPIANIGDCSRKDFREAVVAARGTQEAWAKRAPFNRGQILYRIAEMLEGRTEQFVSELKQQTGMATPLAIKEVQTSIDRFLYYSGWADKYQQVFSSVNPVSSSHFNFSICEPTGVVSILAPENSGLLGLVSTIAPTIAGGNTCIALASTSLPLCAITLAEVLATSDLPGGVVNLLTGHRKELVEHFSSHMDVNAIIHCGDSNDELSEIRVKSAMNVKRVVHFDDRDDWTTDDAQSPYRILETQEIKTTWHPIGA